MDAGYTAITASMDAIYVVSDVRVVEVCRESGLGPRVRARLEIGQTPMACVMGGGSEAQLGGVFIA